MLEKSLVSSQQSVISTFVSSDIVCQAVIILLIMASVWTWATILYKYYYFCKIKKELKVFRKLISSPITIEQIHKEVGLNPGKTLLPILTTAFGEYRQNQNKHSDQQRNNLKDRMLYAMQLTRNQISEKLESYITSLAIISSAAPFIGLLGTVWGIMHSFQMIASSKNTSISIVAPGITEALIATAFGLFAAIPAGIFYNLLTKKLNSMENKIDNFSGHLYLMICKSMDEYDTKK